MSQYLLQMGEDDKKAGIGKMLRAINNTPSTAQKNSEDNESKNKIVTLKQLKENKNISNAFERVEAICSKEQIIKHGKKHAEYVAHTAGEILKTIGFPQKDVNLAEIAGYLHDLGYRLQIKQHPLISAGMAYERLSEMNMAQEEIDKVCLAIASHHQLIENNIGAALIIADTADFNKTRIRDGKEVDTLARFIKQIVENKLIINETKKTITLDLQVELQDSQSKNEFYQCQSEKIALAKDAAKYLGCNFKLVVNGEEII